VSRNGNHNLRRQLKKLCNEGLPAGITRLSGYYISRASNLHQIVTSDLGSCSIVHAGIDYNPVTITVVYGKVVTHRLTSTALQSMPKGTSVPSRV